MLKYGETEELLVKNIDERGYMTIKEIQEITGIQRPDLSSALVALVLTNVLKIEPRDGEDLFLSKQHT